ncbi:transposase [Bifidobacterium longum]|uniref:transposase n=1 Tax=Bifidobacterium longum TaxID=216816 RepID=UPI00387823DE
MLAYFGHRCANAILEGLNGIIRHVRTRSRGFGNMDCSSTVIYLTCDRLGLNTVTA